MNIECIVADDSCAQLTVGERYDVLDVDAPGAALMIMDDDKRAVWVPIRFFDTAVLAGKTHEEIEKLRFQLRRNRLTSLRRTSEILAKVCTWDTFSVLARACGLSLKAPAASSKERLIAVARRHSVKGIDRIDTYHRRLDRLQGWIRARHVNDVTQNQLIRFAKLGSRVQHELMNLLMDLTVATSATDTPSEVPVARSPRPIRVESPKSSWSRPVVRCLRRDDYEYQITVGREYEVIGYDMGRLTIDIQDDFGEQSTIPAELFDGRAMKLVMERDD